MSSASPAGRPLVVQAVIPASAHDVWAAFTTSRGAEAFFAPKANIELRLHGPFEIFFNPVDDRQGTQGLKILSYVPGRMLSMQWNAPPHLPAVREGGMWVVVEMSAAKPEETEVCITHLGLQDGPEWETAYRHFQKGWGDLLDRLRRRFLTGPIDWKAEAMMWKDRQNVEAESKAAG